MEPYTIRLPEDLASDLEGEADDRDLSFAEYVRKMLRERTEHQQLRADNERLQNRVAALIEQRDEHGELVEYVEGERELQRRREQRKNAPVWRRAKWWVFGGPGGE